jgi:hypothetical protein
MACPHRRICPNCRTQTQRKRLIPNKGSLFYSHCGLWSSPKDRKKESEKNVMPIPFRSQFGVCLRKFGLSTPAGLAVKGIRTLSLKNRQY